VLDAAGDPAVGARVRVSWPRPGDPVAEDGVEATVGEDGKFEIEARAGAATLRVRVARGPLVAADTEVPGDAGRDIALTLRLPATFDATGIVVAAEDGRPLEGMRVAAGGVEAETDRLGRFRLEALTAPAAGTAIPFEVSGAGRATVRRDVPADGAFDDLAFRVPAEGAPLPPGPGGR
jgi:hypothetical protein